MLARSYVPSRVGTFLRAELSWKVFPLRRRIVHEISGILITDHWKIHEISGMLHEFFMSVDYNTGNEICWKFYFHASYMKIEVYA